MTSEVRKVAVKQLPERLSMKQGRAFLRELESSMSADRPRIVLDCSNLRQLDRSGAHLLLQCLEEAMKRNGDVRLAAVSPDVRAILVRAGADRLFELFDTTAAAVNSFHQIPIHTYSKAAIHGNSHRDTGTTA